MESVKQISARLIARIHQRPCSPEEIEAARKKAMQRSSMCSIDCPICGGLGYIHVEFGRLEPCPNVSGLDLFPGERYGLDMQERALTWSAVLPVNGVAAGVAAVRGALERGAGWVYLWGPPGVAKTLLLKIAVAESLRARQKAAYTRMAEILEDMRAAYYTRDPSSESQRRLDWWAGLPLLAIDEFDRMRGTEYALERRFLLMDRRYENAIRAPGGSPSITLMASNEDPALLDGYLFDRIRDGRFAILHLTGDSLRTEMEW